VIGGHRRICSKSYGKRHRGTRSAAFERPKPLFERFGRPDVAAAAADADSSGRKTATEGALAEALHHPLLLLLEESEFDEPYVTNARLAAAMARRVSTWSPSVTRPISLPLVGLMMSMVSRPWDLTNAPSI
jgi:hypothetical protein